MPDHDNWIDRTAIDSDGSKIGKIADLYLDDATSQPEWITVATGLFGSHQTFVPVTGAAVRGDDVQVPYTKDFIKDAPRIDPDGAHLSDAEEAELYRYYGRGDEYDAGIDRITTVNDGTAAVDRTSTDRGATDDAMTRSEEEVDVSTRTRETGRARLRKWVETENVQITVPVQREVARMVTEPVTADNIDKAMDGADITENEYDVVLHEEQIVVDKKVVPKERVRLETDTVEDQQVVSEEVRKERIAMEADDRTTRVTRD
jgi:uncharacterized protein (TIGR02271 family)